MLEAAIAIPLLIMLMFGTLEAGMAWEAKSAATSGLRTGILRAASLANEPETDLLVLQSIVGEVGASRIDSLEYVIIFDADYVSLGTPQQIALHCASQTIPISASAAAGVQDVCVIYGPGHLNAVVNGTLTLNEFDDGSNANTVTGGYDCDTTSSPTKIDKYWCAGDRVTTAQTSRNVGVYIKYDHKWFTGVLPGDGVEFSDFAVSSTLRGEQAP